VDSLEVAAEVAVAVLGALHLLPLPPLLLHLIIHHYYCLEEDCY
jgi:hypothetical protein